MTQIESFWGSATSYFPKIGQRHGSVARTVRKRPIRAAYGETITLSELRGQVVTVNFWVFWCPPCREEAPYLEATWRKYQDEGVFFIGVDYVDTESKALAYIDEYDITYFNGPDIGTHISRDYDMWGVPETFYVAKNGELRGLKVGPLAPPELDQMIDELLAELYNGE